MSIERWTERLMGMDDRTWRRHGNPWSGWTRMAILPLLALAIWSRIWIGPWAWAMIGACIVWAWINPRAFPEPAHLNNWMSQGILGERIWLARKISPIPDHHRALPNMLNIAGIPFVILLGFGLYHLQVISTVLSLALLITLKLWFLDRMVWLFRDVRPHFMNSESL